MSKSEEKLPRVIVFDLDGLIWSPEMYELGGGAPFKPDKTNPDIMVGCTGERVQLIGETRAVIQMLATDPKWANTYLAIASTCDHPAWAKELLDLYKFKDAAGRDVPMSSLFSDAKEIYYASKAKHHAAILQKIGKIDPGVTDYSQMLFFDNQMNNIRAVSAIGVPCCYCYDGLVKGSFEKGLEVWRKHQSSL